MYAFAPTQVVLVTDTLSTSTSGDPHIFVSKCFVIPHLEMVVAGTGVALISQRWAHQLQTAVLARDIDFLDHLVPAALTQVVTDLNGEFGELPGTSTVYHFGYSEDREEYVGYAYRSEHDFVSEPLQSGGFGVKPRPIGDFSSPNDMNEMVQLGRRIRAEQDGLPEGRIYIGGELCMTALINRTITVSKLFRFEDFEDQWLTMNENLQ